MVHAVNPSKIAGVAFEASKAVSNKGFDNVEVLLGLSELMGRIIVELGDTKIQIDELCKVSSDHLTRTVVAGAQARGKGNLVLVQ